MTKTKVKKEASPRKKAIEYALTPIAYIFLFGIVSTLLTDKLHFNEHLCSEAAVALAAIFGMFTVNKITGDSLKNSIRIKNLDIITIIIAVVLTYAGGEVIDNIVAHLLSNFMTVKENRDIPFTLIGCFCSVICAPVFEEIIFRYSMRSALKDHYSVKFIVIFSSVVFALVHFYNIQGCLNVFVQAIFLILIYHYTNNLLITISIHAIHNALCFIPIEDFAYRTVNGFVYSTPVWFGINLVLTIISEVLFFRYFVPKYIKSDISDHTTESSR